MLAPNQNEVLKTETVSSYTIGKTKHVHLRLTFYNRSEMKELLVPIWDESDLPDMPFINTKSPLWRGVR